jgi:uncharacterized protein YgiM (DUF1202 family)
LALGVALASFSALAAYAEQAWVRGDVRLNLRTGAGTQFRIVGGAGTGDPVTILQRSEKWTQIQMENGREGWIPVGYLQPDPPPTVRLARLEKEVVGLRSQLETTSGEAGSLRESNQELTSRDDEQRADIERLTMENMDLKAGERWPYLITGASIFVAGMILGGILHAMSSARSRRPRVRL